MAEIAEQRLGSHSFEHKVYFCCRCCPNTWRTDELTLTTHRTMMTMVYTPDFGLCCCTDNVELKVHRTIFNKDIVAINRKTMHISPKGCRSYFCCVPAMGGTFFSVSTPPMLTNNGYMQVTVKEEEFDKAYNELCPAITHFKYAPKARGPQAQQMMF